MITPIKDRAFGPDETCPEKQLQVLGLLMDKSWSETVDETGLVYAIFIHRPNQDSSINNAPIRPKDSIVTLLLLRAP